MKLVKLLKLSGPPTRHSVTKSAKRLRERKIQISSRLQLNRKRSLETTEKRIATGRVLRKISLM